MGGVRVIGGEEIVQSMLGSRSEGQRSIGNIQTEAAEFWSADQKEKGGDRFSSLAQIAESGFNQVTGR